MTNKSSSILLESDTNELEIVEFRVDEYDNYGNIVECWYGVNVAKVREIIRIPQIRSAINTAAGISGMIKLRDKIVAVINLPELLNKNTGDIQPEKIIVLEFNDVSLGVMVHSVNRIHRLSWNNIEAVPESLAGEQITGIVKMDNHIILMLDFEKIAGLLLQQSALKEVSQEIVDSVPLARRSSHSIVIAEDSSFIRQTMFNKLSEAGYKVFAFENGQEAWNFIKDNFKLISLIVTDIEMPQMDGLHLTSKIRKEINATIPIVIFSSLASDNNKLKWETLGANAILTKPDLPKLVQEVDSILNLL